MHFSDNDDYKQANWMWNDWQTPKVDLERTPLHARLNGTMLKRRDNKTKQILEMS